jgi:nitrile hydratase
MAWRDDAFRRRLIRNPRAVLKELGLRVPKGVKIKVLQNTARMMYVVLPAKPKGKRHHVAPVGPEDDI